MRERTTWNRQEIARDASEAKTAEDPRAMNQDHHAQQPAADAYLTGGPSEFAEDVHPSAGTWKAEQEGGETERNEIGMPEMRDDTFKTAGLDEETLTKKAEVCIRVARQMLGGAEEKAVEDQAYALMHLPDVELIQTADRLAKGKVPPQFLEQQEKMKEKAKEKSDEDEGEGQQQKGQGEGQGQQKGQQQKQAKKSEDEDEDEGQGEGEGEGQAKQAKKSEDEDEGEAQDEGEAEEQAKQAAADFMKQATEALQAGNQEAFQKAVQGYTLSEIQRAMQPQQAPPQQQAAAGCMSAEQIQKMVQQAVQQQLPPQQGVQQQPMPQQLSDDQLLDQMLQDEAPVQQAPPMDIQLEGAPMDIGETPLGPEDEVLGQLFASHKEVQQAAHAQALQGETPPVITPPVKTASTRTVGTRPTGGVAQIGGAAASAPEGSDVDKLSGLWKSAPDVSGVFNPEG